MNLMNTEEPTRYIPVSECQYLVDQDRKFVSEHEPRYLQSPEWVRALTLTLL
jgi:hypothetical protein